MFEHFRCVTVYMTTFCAGCLLLPFNFCFSVLTSINESLPQGTDTTTRSEVKQVTPPPALPGAQPLERQRQLLSWDAVRLLALARLLARQSCLHRP
jgi:hypothetical protein